MKKAIIRIFDIVLTIIMVLSVLYSLFNITMSFLPAEIQEKVYGWLHLSSEYIATFSISATINAVVLVASKIAQTYTRISLTNKLLKAEDTITQDRAVNDIVIERVNSIINNLNVLQTLNNALLSVQKVTTERNIKASDKLVQSADKEAYKSALNDIEKAREELSQLSNISTVYEKTEIKEVVVEKMVEPKDEFSGRV